MAPTVSGAAVWFTVYMVVMREKAAFIDIRRRP